MIKKFFLAILFGLNSLLAQPQAVSVPTPASSVKLFPSATPVPSNAQMLADIAAIKTAFAAKYNRKPKDVILTTTAYDNNHFLGTVTFNLAMEGGILLAAKATDNDWVIVADGNGVIPCETAKEYQFPVNMVTECSDRNGKIVKLK